MTFRIFVYILLLSLICGCISKKKYQASTTEAQHAKNVNEELTRKNNELQTQLNDAVASNKLLAEERESLEQVKAASAAEAQKLKQQLQMARMFFWQNYMDARQDNDVEASEMFELSKSMAAEEQQQASESLDPFAIIDPLPDIQRVNHTKELRTANFSEVETFARLVESQLGSNAQIRASYQQKYIEFLTTPTATNEQSFRRSINDALAKGDKRISVRFTTTVPNGRVKYQQWRTGQRHCSRETNNCRAQLLPGGVLFWVERNGKPTSKIIFSEFYADDDFKIPEP